MFLLRTVNSHIFSLIIFSLIIITFFTSSSILEDLF